MQKEVVHIVTILLLLLLFTKLTFDAMILTAVLMYVLQKDPQHG